jgi:hypothetical protein
MHELDPVDPTDVQPTIYQLMELDLQRIVDQLGRPSPISNGRMLRQLPWKVTDHFTSRVVVGPLTWASRHNGVRHRTHDAAATIVIA